MLQSNIINHNLEKIFPYIHITHVSNDIIRRTGLRIKYAMDGADHEYTEKRIHLFSVMPELYTTYVIDNGVRRKLTIEEKAEIAFNEIQYDPVDYLSNILTDKDLDCMFNDVISYKAELLNLSFKDFNIYACKLSESYPVYSDTIMTSNKARYVTQNIPAANVKLLGSADILQKIYNSKG